MSNAAAQAVDHDELALLKRLALAGGIDGEIKTSCGELAEELDVSTQTISRRLQQLEDTGLIVRDTVSDGQWVDVTSDGERELRSEYEDYRRIFESVSSAELVGAVTSGMGEGRHYITLDGYMQQFRERLGYEPFPGTLNVALTDASVRRQSALDAMEPIPIDGWEDDERTYGPAFCYRASAASGDQVVEQAHVIAPERTHHDEDQLEVIAPVKLRDALDLEEGDHMRVIVTE